MISNRNSADIGARTDAGTGADASTGPDTNADPKAAGDRAPEDLSILLVFPPQGHPTQPYLALPSLKAYLAEHGFTGATVWDLNLEAYDQLLSPERLALATRRIRERAEDWAAPDRQQLLPDELDRYRLEADALASGTYLAEHIDAAKDVIRSSGSFYYRPRYLWAQRTFEAGLKLLSTEYQPALFTAHNYTQSTSIDSTTDLFAGVDHPTENMFREFYEQVALPRIERERPDVLGISVTYGSQMVPALTLATLVKQRWPDIHITLGGGMLAYVGQRLAHAGPLFDRVDSIVVYEGEHPLLELCQALLAAGNSARRAAPDLTGIGNLICRESCGTKDAPPVLPTPIDELPTPDFSDLPLERYFSGELVLPIAPARGCYFEKCGFCTLYTAIGPTFRERSVDRLVEDLQVLVERHGTPYFYFILDDLPPLMAKRIPDAFEAAGLDVRWWCDARLEERIFHPASLKRLHDAGCRKLMYGFESGSQRLLDLVEKGVDLEQAERVLKATAEAGISATLYTMVGLPTETREEADATRAFIVRNAPYVGEISLQIFNLDMVSPMYRDPQRFGIAEVIDDPRDLAPGERPQQDLARYLEHTSVSGMTRSEVKQAFNNILGAATDALAALRGDNFLYYRYKSHIFLYLCKFGPDVFRREHHALARADRAAPVSSSCALPEQLALRADVRLVELPFSYGDVSRRLDRVWSDPTPLGGVARSESRAAADATPVEPRACSLAFLGDEHRVIELGADAGRLLHAAERQGTQVAVDAYQPEHQQGVARFLARAVDMGLLVCAGKTPLVAENSPEKSYD
jgi:anaerobic magnesium-protoporphyrin IX monomethyl ester cyclase